MRDGKIARVEGIVDTAAITGAFHEKPRDASASPSAIACGRVQGRRGRRGGGEASRRGACGRQRLAVAAEELGYARFRTAEVWTNDAVVLLTQIAAATSRIGLASAVLSIWSRTPAAIAMAAAGLQRASDGRFALGLGASSPPLVEGMHGLTWRRPIDRMRTVLVAVRALLDGARLPLDRQGVRALRLGALPQQPVPIVLEHVPPHCEK